MVVGVRRSLAGSTGQDQRWERLERKVDMPLSGPPNMDKLAAAGDLKGLTNALGYPRDSVREGTARALRRIGAPAVEPLIGALHDNDANTRTRAVSTLGQN